MIEEEEFVQFVLELAVDRGNNEGELNERHHKYLLSRIDFSL